MNKEDFLTDYPEFEPADAEFPGMIERHLAKAAQATRAAWGDKLDQVVALTAAQSLAVTPFGRNAKLSSSQGKSTYGVLLKAMRTAFACAFNRLG